MHPKIEILVGQSGIEQLQSLILSKAYRRCYLLSETNVMRFCYPLLEGKLFRDIDVKQIILPFGESNKSLDSAIKIWQTLIESSARKNDLIVNFGGGMITDLGAFSASIFKRGIDFVNIPTTLLGMVDAAYGGKTAVNFWGIKNQIGNYGWPQAILINEEFLKTLDGRELRCGKAEMLKAGLIADARLWQDLTEIRINQVPPRELILKALQVKINIVFSDPYENGNRKLLNFGHTCGHALESLTAKTEQALLHGEAVALGFLFEAYLSYKLCALPLKQLIVIRDIIFDCYSDLDFEDVSFESLLSFMYHDKKNRSGINFTLLQRIGSGIIDRNVEPELIREALDWCKAHFNSKVIAG